jgi:hypothetical protein
MESLIMRDLHLRAKREERSMTTRGGASFVLLLPVAVLLCTLLFMPGLARAQNVQVDLSATSALCGGQECFNTAGIFNTGVQFLGTSGMDNGNNCTPTPPYTNCPDAYSANQLGLSNTTPPTLTPPSLNVPFNFGAVNTASCGPATTISCTVNVVNLTASGVALTLPAAQQAIYSTIIVLGTAVNGHHSGSVKASYTDGTSTVFDQTYSDWCGFGGNKYESVAVGGINRINSDGTLNGASCNLYAYTYPVDFTRTLQGITLTDVDGSGAMFALAITLKPPTYTIDGGTASPSSLTAGSTATSTVTVNPQPGYVGSIQLSCAISPTIQTSSSATAPSCSLSPTTVDVTAGETAPPTTTLTFTSIKPKSASLDLPRNIFYALWLPIPGLALIGLGARHHRRKNYLGLLLLGLLLAALLASSGCVTYKHLGNVGTPPGQYTVSITGVDANGLSQASNPAGTTNTVTVVVTDN